MSLVTGRGSLTEVLVGLVMLVIAAGWLVAGSNGGSAGPVGGTDRWAFRFGTDVNIDRVLDHAARPGERGRDAANLVFSPAFVRGAPVDARPRAEAMRVAVLGAVGHQLTPQRRSELFRQYRTLARASVAPCAKARGQK